MNYLLDSCALIWLVNGDQQLSPEARKLCGDPLATVLVSVATAWEMALKQARRKLLLQVPMLEWWRKAVDRHGLIELPITASIAISAAELPHIHNDPFDRALIATAREHRLILLTPDPMIRSYPDLSTAW